MRSADVATFATFQVTPPSPVSASWPLAPGAKAAVGTGPRRTRENWPPISPPIGR